MRRLLSLHPLPLSRKLPMSSRKRKQGKLETPTRGKLQLCAALGSSLQLSVFLVTRAGKRARIQSYLEVYFEDRRAERKSKSFLWEMLFLVLVEELATVLVDS